jgi:hypothetical protein
MGAKVRRLRASGTTRAGGPTGDQHAISTERAKLVLPVLAQILGVPYDGDN